MADLRQRDALPLPVGRRAGLPPKGAVSRSVRRRLERRVAVRTWEAEAAVALNCLGGFAAVDVVEAALLTPPLCQIAASELLRNSVHKWGKPDGDLTGRGAFEELQACHMYTGEKVTVAPLDISLLSLSGAGAAKDLAHLVPGGGGEVERFIRDCCLHKDQAEAGLQHEDVPRRPYLDPSLRNPRKYEKLLNLLDERGMIEWSFSVKEVCGLFAVWERSGKQRLIVDARRGNKWFTPPPKTRLATGDSFARLHATAGAALELGQTDIQDAFYQMLMPEQLRPCFGLPRVRASRVGVTRTVEGTAVGPDAWIFPRLRVLAMGWTHALHCCQKVLEAAAERAPLLSPANRVVDRSPVPSMFPFVTPSMSTTSFALAKVKVTVVVVLMTFVGSWNGQG